MNIGRWLDNLTDEQRDRVITYKALLIPAWHGCLVTVAVGARDGALRQYSFGQEYMNTKPSQRRRRVIWSIDHQRAIIAVRFDRLHGRYRKQLAKKYGVPFGSGLTDEKLSIRISEEAAMIVTRLIKQRAARPNVVRVLPPVEAQHRLWNEVAARMAFRHPNTFKLAGV